VLSYQENCPLLTVRRVHKKVIQGVLKIAETRNVESKHRRAFAETLLQWKSNKYYTFLPCVSVALIIKHARRMRRILMPRVACLTRPHFSSLSHNPYDFRETTIKENICFNFFYNFCLKTFLILTLFQRDIILNAQTSSCIIPLILVTC